MESLLNKQKTVSKSPNLTKTVSFRLNEMDFYLLSEILKKQGYSKSFALRTLTKSLLKK